MKHSTPKVTIDLAEYLELTGKTPKVTTDLKSKLHKAENLLLLHQMFIGRLYKELSATNKLTHHRTFERVGSGLNAKLVYKGADIEIKPLG